MNNPDRELVFVWRADPYESDWWFYIYDNKWKKACDRSHGVCSTNYSYKDTEKLRQAVRYICEQCDIVVNLSSNNPASWAARKEYV